MSRRAWFHAALSAWCLILVAVNYHLHRYGWAVGVAAALGVWLTRLADELDR